MSTFVLTLAGLALTGVYVVNAEYGRLRTRRLSPDAPPVELARAVSREVREAGGRQIMACYRTPDPLIDTTTYRALYREEALGQLPAFYAEVARTGTTTLWVDPAASAALFPAAAALEPTQGPAPAGALTSPAGVRRPLSLAALPAPLEYLARPVLR